MRLLILFLIFLNVAFFYWAQAQDFDINKIDKSKLLTGYPKIQLLNEQNKNLASLSAKDSSGNEQNNAVANDAICHTMGPFDNERERDELYVALLELGIDTSQRVVNERQPKSYWVYLPPYASLVEAEATVAYLENNKVDEHFIMLEPPEHQFAISLGLFEQLSAARSTLAEIKKLNLKPEMEVRFNEFTQYWVDFRQYTNAEQPIVLESLLAKNERLLLLGSECL